MNAAAEGSTWRAELESERTRMREWLRRSPASYLAAIERVDFGERTTLLVGRSADAQVGLADEGVAPRHLSISLKGESFLLEALDEAASFATSQGVMRSATVGPSLVKVGRFTLRLSHQGFPAVVVFDARMLNERSLPEPRWWPPTPGLRIMAALERSERPVERVIQSTRGHPRRALSLGAFVFEVNGVVQRLEATRLLEPGVDETAVSVFFRDATTGRGSYPVGRYLDPRPCDEGRWTLDFNRAFNPACAWSPHYNCPIPPRANTLTVPIEAGEMAPAEP